MTVLRNLIKNAGVIKYSESVKNKIINFIITNWQLLKEDRSTKDFVAMQYIKLKSEDFPKEYNITQDIIESVGDLAVKILFYKNRKEIEKSTFFEKRMLLTIIVPLNNKFDLKFSSISSTIEHELMHLTQYLLSKKVKPKQKDDDFYIKFYEYAESKGFDISKLSEKDVNALIELFKAENKYSMTENYSFGLPKEFNENKYRDIVKEDFGYVHHDQLPFEFFPVLNDILNDFAKKQNGTKQYLLDFINRKEGTDSSKEFIYRIKYNPDLYNRFLKEIYKKYQELNAT